MRARSDHERKLLIAVTLALLVFALEAVGGYVTNSLALLSDAAHVFMDISALLLAYASARVVAKPPTARRTYGHHRVEILAALANGVLLVGIAVYLLLEASERFAAPPAIAGGTVSVVGLAAMAGNLSSAYVLHGAAAHNMNIKGAYFHVLSDVGSSAGVIVAGAAIALTGIYVLDPLTSVGIAALVAYGGIRIVREALPILLQSSPEGLETEGIRRAVGGIDGVVEVHDLHVWSLSQGRHVATLHVVAEARRAKQPGKLINEVTELLKREYGIEHATVQVEPQGHEHAGDVHE